MSEVKLCVCVCVFFLNNFMLTMSCRVKTKRLNAAFRNGCDAYLRMKCISVKLCVLSIQIEMLQQSLHDQNAEPSAYAGRRSVLSFSI